MNDGLMTSRGNSDFNGEFRWWRVDLEADNFVDKVTVFNGQLGKFL